MDEYRRTLKALNRDLEKGGMTFGEKLARQQPKRWEIVWAILLLPILLPLMLLWVAGMFVVGSMVSFVFLLMTLPFLKRNKILKNPFNKRTRYD